MRSLRSGWARDANSNFRGLVITREDASVIKWLLPPWLPPASYSAYTNGDECRRRFGLWSRGSMNIVGCKWLSSMKSDRHGRLRYRRGARRQRGRREKNEVSTLNGWWERDRRSLPSTTPSPAPVRNATGGTKKGRTTREHIVVQSRRRRTIGNEEGDSAEKDVGCHQGWFAV